MLNYVYRVLTQQQFIYYSTCISTLSSYYYLISTILASAPSIFTSLLLGPISDMMGRKIAIYLPIIRQVLYNSLGSLITGIGINFMFS